MKRILVIGSGGSGKSTLSVKLGASLGIEVFHLDKLFWNAGWIETDRDKWQNVVTKLLSREKWIIDGNFSGTLQQRIVSCDTIVFLDFSRALCLWRIFKRRFHYHQRTRPDMAEGCNERLNLEFVEWILNYPRRTRPKVLKLMSLNATNKKIFWLKSPQQVKAFLLSLEKPSPGSTL